MMDLHGVIMLISGTAVWAAAIVVEAYVGSEHLIPPCDTERKFTGYNMVFIAFPIALILVAEIRMLQDMGALGLTCTVETLCLLGIAGYDQLLGMHAFLCFMAGLSLTLVCFNVAFWCGLVVGVPLLLLSMFFLVCRITCFSDMNNRNPAPFISFLFWLLDIWLILGRVVLAWAEPSDWVDHYWFDIIAATALVSVLVLLFGCMLGIMSLPQDSWLRRIIY